MADEKKTVKKEDTSKAVKKTNIFKRMGKAIAKFFKDLRGETKKIVWPGRHMVLKSTGIVLAAILVIGAVIWLLDFAVSGAVKGLSNIANKTEVTETVTDEAAYQDAMNEYNYKVQQYEKTIADINARTSIIQEEDRTLELRLKQLDTEQKALATEMDAVKKVISDNIEKTFKTFSD